LLYTEAAGTIRIAIFNEVDQFLGNRWQFLLDSGKFDFLLATSQAQVRYALSLVDEI